MLKVYFVTETGLFWIPLNIYLNNMGVIVATLFYIIIFS